MGVTFDLDSKEIVLHFIQHSQFRKAPNPGIHIMKAYKQRTKSTIEWDDFKRVLHELVNDECLELSTGLHGEDCYFLLNKKRKLSETHPYLDWAIKGFISAIITSIIGLLIALPKYQQLNQKSKQQDTLIHILNQRIDSLRNK